MDLENKKQELEKIRKMLQAAEENIKYEELKKIEAEKTKERTQVIKPNKILGINQISFLNKTLIVITGIIILSGLVLAVNNTIKLSGLVFAMNDTIKLSESEWTCIANQCSEYATGDDWVKQNCNAEGNEMICDFQYEGQNFRVPLSGIENVSNMVSCKTYECSSMVLISKK